jgi:hypothetical protein
MTLIANVNFNAGDVVHGVFPDEALSWCRRGGGARRRRPSKLRFGQ